MKIPYSWLKDYVGLDSDAADVAADMVRLGHEVEALKGRVRMFWACVLAKSNPNYRIPMPIS